jgi:DNA-binding NarL/FixJ family response regulator
MEKTQPIPTLHSRILIINNHELVAEGLKQLLEPEFEIAGILTNYVDIVGPALALKPDVILCKISMSLLDVLRAAKRVTEVLPEAKIVYLSADTDSSLAIEAFDRGCASGYLLKTSSASELTIAIRSVLRGQSYISSSLRDIVDLLRWEKKTGVDELDRLTQRQREVLGALLEGKTMRMAASALGMTPRTVAYHKYRLMERLGARSNADLIKFGVRNHLFGELARHRNESHIVASAA